jgi:hypothetical protein
MTQSAHAKGGCIAFAAHPGRRNGITIDNRGDDARDADWQEKRARRLFNLMDSSGND